MAIPQGVRDVVGRRLDRLSEAANEVLLLAAICGREFRLEILVRVSHRPEPEVVAALREAVGAHLIVESGDDPGRFWFAHALVNETLHAEVPAARCAAIHSEIGAALEAAPSSDPDRQLGELARHFLAAGSAGDLERAVDYATLAAARAGERLAHEDAASLYAKALDALDLIPEPGVQRQLTLLLKLGEAQTRAARNREARASLERAAELARGLDSSEDLGRAAVAISFLAEAGVVDEPMIGLLEDALAASGEEDSPLRSQILSSLAQQLYWIDAAGRSSDLGLEELEMARRLDDPRSLALALIRRQFTGPIGPAEVRRRLQESDELHDLAKRLGDLELELRAHIYRLHNRLELGDIHGADADLAAY